MNSSEQFKQYTEKVCQQIRWKKAHGVVAQEIENHLIDQKNAYIDMGDSESTAEEKALLQMGDPVTVGAALDSTHKPAPQWGMMGLVMVLLFVGAVIQFLFVKNTLSDAAIQYVSMNALILFLPISLAVFFMAYFLDFSFFGKHPYLLPVALIIIDILSQFFGTEVGGTYMWLRIWGHYYISPKSLSLIFPLAFCGLFYHLRKKGNQGYFLGGLAAALFCVLLLSWHTAGGLCLFLFSAGILMFVAAKKNWFGDGSKIIFALLVGIAVSILFFLLFAVPMYRYRLSGLMDALHPEADPNGTGYMTMLLREMLENSVLLGSGTPIDLSHNTEMYS